MHPLSAIAGEIKIFSIRRPDGAPVHVFVMGHRNRRSTRCRDGPDVAMPSFIYRPIGDAMAVRGPLGLYGVFVRDEPLLAGGNVHGPHMAHGNLSVLRACNTLLGAENLFPVWRPRRIETEVSQAPDRLAAGSHNKDASTLALRAKGNLFAVRRERGLRVFRPGVLREIDRFANP